MLDKMAEWGLVKFFGSLINPTTLGKRLDKVVEMYNSNSFMQTAKRLFFWAVLIIIIATIIDLTFYWLRPEQKERLEKAKELLLEFKHRYLSSRPQRGRQMRK